MTYKFRDAKSVHQQSACIKYIRRKTKISKSVHKATFSFMPEDFWDPCCKPANPKYSPLAKAHTIRHSGTKKETIPTSPKQMLAKPNSRRIGKLSEPSILKICLAVNSGSLICFIPAKNKRSPTAEKINHLLNDSNDKAASIVK